MTHCDLNQQSATQYQKRTYENDAKSKMSLLLVLPHIITICDGKADFVQRFFTFSFSKSIHYMSLAHVYSDIINDRKWMFQIDLNMKGGLCMMC